jgi:hypothetical protein
MTFSHRELKVAWGTGVSHNHEVAAILEAPLPQPIIKVPRRLPRVDEHHRIGFNRFRLGLVSDIHGTGMLFDLCQFGTDQWAK